MNYIFVVKLITALLLLPAFLYRWSRWLAIIQQKEYRVDRLLSFFRSQEGQQDLQKFLPSREDFTKTGFKRPVRTGRIYLAMLANLLAFLIIGVIGWWGSILFYVGCLAALYILLPLVIFVSMLPVTLLVYYMTDIALREARARLRISKPIIIGITGSYGKTSTKLLLAHVLATKYPVFYTPKSHNTRLSVAQAINNSYKAQRIVVLEYAAYNQHEIRDLAYWFQPTLAVITGLAPQHLDLFGSINNIIVAKSQLVKSLANKDLVFCNAADPGAIKICQMGGSRNFVAYTGPDSSVKFSQVKLTDLGLLSFVWQGHKINTRLVGRHYLASVAATICVAQQLEVSETQIVAALKNFVPPDSFIQLRLGRDDCLIINDGGTSNPSGFAAALDLLKWYHQQKYQTVLITAGIIDLGQESDAIHQQLAALAESIVDQVFYVGVTGRKQFQQVFGDQCLVTETQIKQAISQFGQNCVVLIEGRMPKWIKL